MVYEKKKKFTCRAKIMSVVTGSPMLKRKLPRDSEFNEYDRFTFYLWLDRNLEDSPRVSLNPPTDPQSIVYRVEISEVSFVATSIGPDASDNLSLLVGDPEVPKKLLEHFAAGSGPEDTTGKRITTRILDWFDSPTVSHRSKWYVKTALLIVPYIVFRCALTELMYSLVSYSTVLQCLSFFKEVSDELLFQKAGFQQRESTLTVSQLQGDARSLFGKLTLKGRLWYNRMLAKNPSNSGSMIEAIADEISYAESNAVTTRDIISNIVLIVTNPAVSVPWNFVDKNLSSNKKSIITLGENWATVAFAKRMYENLSSISRESRGLVNASFWGNNLGKILSFFGYGYLGSFCAPLYVLMRLASRIQQNLPRIDSQLIASIAAIDETMVKLYKQTKRNRENGIDVPYVQELVQILIVSIEFRLKKAAKRLQDKQDKNTEARNSLGRKLDASIQEIQTGLKQATLEEPDVKILEENLTETMKTIEELLKNLQEGKRLDIFQPSVM